GLEIEFPFYGDLLDELVRQSRLPDTMEKAIARGPGSAPDLEFFNDFLTELAHNEGVADSDILNQFVGDPRERGPLNWEWVQAILKALDKTSLGNFSIKQFTYDAYLYLTIPGIQRKIDEFVSAHLPAEPCVVVGHSLGSTVGYNVLKHGPQFQVMKYITVGSPLGLRSFSRKLETPIEKPACIKGGWFNAYDERDVVALQPLDKNHFNITPAVENYNKVRNGTNNRHGIEGYLSDAEVAKVIFDALL
ncbi:MAG TPA: hypothetical protein PLA68_13110, partial [Panacibacter sp.]|nr:hypothetical protein [Panacibacter sp.]